jgi:hypothetical protein
MKCKFQIEKESIGWWGTVLSLFCIKNNQFLAGATCQGCPDYKSEEENETKD